MKRILDVRVLLALLIAAQARIAPADELQTAYAAVLNGDVAAGKAEVAKLLDSGANAPEVQRFSDWLSDYDKVQSGRDDLRRKSYDWNVEQAGEALQKDRIYLALTFASSATLYADDAKSVGKLPWAAELAEKAKAEAQKLHDKSEWSKKSAYYFHLARLFPDDKQIEDARKDSDRHARLEILYKDKKAVELRTEDVSEVLVERALQLVDRSYYTDPDFKAMAQGALHSLLLLCDTPKLREVGGFDGLANPDLRKYFEDNVRSSLKKIEDAESVSYNQLKRLFNEVAKFNDKSIELPKGVLVIEFLEGAIGKLDQFSSMVWPADEREFSKQIMGNFCGVGIQLGFDEFTHRLKVATPLDNSPALEAGVQPGDLIVEVDGKTTKGWTSDEAVRKITGKPNTKVTLTLVRPSTGERKDFELTRRQIILTTVHGVNRQSDAETAWNYILDDTQGVAYIRLSGFNPDSEQELAKALHDAKKQGMKGLVLDLRFNPGGLLDIAIETVSTFVKSGMVVRTSGRREKPQIAEVAGDAEFADLPIVVLVNDSSASAAEILSGALQDHKRAVVLGERTFGKGSVQKVLELSKDAKLRLTTALYYLPSGRSPHKGNDESKTWGVEPNMKIELSPKEIRAVLDRERSSEVIKNKIKVEEAAPVDEEERKKRLAAFKEEDKNGDEKADDAPLLSEEEFALLTSDPHKAPDADAQLQMALLVMRAKLASNMGWPTLAAKPDAPRTSTP